MFNTPNSVKSLRKYYKDRYADVVPQHLAVELGGESDRAIVILLSSVLDDVLVHRLANKLTLKPDQAQTDYIFRFEGPLGTFSARIEIAYLFGFIDEQTRSQLDILRDMRNACAHSRKKTDFDVPELAAVAKRFIRQHGEAPPKLETRKQIRDAFSAECVFVLQLLVEDSREQAEQSAREILAGKRFVPPPSPDKPPRP